MPIITSRFPQLQPRGVKAAAAYLHKKLTDSPYIWVILFAWLFVHVLGKIVNRKDSGAQSRIWIHEWELDNTILTVLKGLGLEEALSWKSLTVVKLLTGYQKWFEAKSADQKQAFTILETLFKDGEVRQFLGVNQYNDVWWFNKETFDEMLWWLMIVAALTIGSDPSRPINVVVEELEGCYSTIQTWQKAEEESEYQVEKLLSLLQK